MAHLENLSLLTNGYPCYILFFSFFRMEMNFLIIKNNTCTWLKIQVQKSKGC